MGARRVGGAVVGFVLLLSSAACTSGTSAATPSQGTTDVPIPQAVASQVAASKAAAGAVPASSADPFASRAAASAKAGEGPSPAADGRDALPQATAKALSNVTFGSASSALTKQFAPVTRSVSTVVTGTQLRSVSLGGRPLGGVALYEVPAAVSASTQFQDQFVVQLLSTLAAGSAPTFVRIEGKPVAVCHGAKACAGWFDGTRAVIVVRESGSTQPEVFAASILKHAKAL